MLRKKYKYETGFSATIAFAASLLAIIWISIRLSAVEKELLHYLKGDSRLANTRVELSDGRHTRIAVIIDDCVPCFHLGGFPDCSKVGKAISATFRFSGNGSKTVIAFLSLDISELYIADNFSDLFDAQIYSVRIAHDQDLAVLLHFE